MKIEAGRSLELDTKAVTDEGVFEGYASVFGAIDLHKEVVGAGAFKASLAARPAGRVKMLRQHDQAQPIGVWTDMAEDSHGLHVKGRLILDVPLARETHALMKAGALDGLSIGFRAKRERFDRTKGLRHLEEIDLREISVVTFPCLPDATVSAVKHDHPDQARAIVAALHRATSALRSL